MITCLECRSNARKAFLYIVAPNWLTCGSGDFNNFSAMQRREFR